MNASDPTPEIRPRSTLALVHTTSGESCILNHLCKLGLRREFANRLHKVLIRLAVSRKQRAQDGDDRERILVIRPAQSIERQNLGPLGRLPHLRSQDWVRHFAELQAGKDASGLQHAIRFLENLGRRRTVPDPEGYGI